jgi:mxaJ protein
MSFACHRLALAMVGLLCLTGTATARDLTVCADPNNLPFSNANGDGFENKIAELIARELGAEPKYFWWPQRRGFLRNTLNAGECDLVTGSVLGMEMLRSTIPYYRSSYVFVTRAGGIHVASLDDDALHQVRIGIQLIGSDNPPPAQALASRGLVRNVRGFPVYGDDRDADPGSGIIAAVAEGDIDVAIAWGPLAGYYATREKVALNVTPVEPQVDGPRSPMVFDVTMGVRKGDDSLRDDVNRAINQLRPEIDRILAAYGVPRLDGAGKRAGAAR